MSTQSTRAPHEFSIQWPIGAHGDPDELLKWAIICGLATVFGLAIATLKYACDTYHLPSNKAKRAKKSEENRKKKELQATLAVRQKMVPTEDFRDVYKRKKTDKTLTSEVRAIVMNQAVLNKEVALSAENIAKNISTDVVTSDEARVILEDRQEGQSDYINASFITGYLDDVKHYIASQSPVSMQAIPDFWQMVWQEGVTCIVMAMGLFQETSIRCVKYWENPMHKNSFSVFGPFRVSTEQTDVTTNFVRRKLRLFKEGEATVRNVTHLEFHSWNDEDSCIDPSVLLTCRHRARMEHKSGPLLVHCRCGGGKTAMFIALDYLLEQIDDWACVDVYSTVLLLRKYRANMIRTLSQYRTIYDALSLYISSGHTIIPYNELPTVTERMSVKESYTGSNSFQREFRTIKEHHPNTRSMGVAGHHIDNRGKSRQVMMQPDDQFRPYLYSVDNETDTDYINAVYVDGFCHKNSYIVTEWPQLQTINNFWSLVYDHNIRSVVLLNNSPFSKIWPRFWPQICNGETSHTYGSLAIRYHDCIKTNFYTIRVFSIHRLPKMKLFKDNDMVNMMESLMRWSASSNSREDERVVKIFQLKRWRNRHSVPSSPKPLIYFFDVVEEWQEHSRQLNPICVVSRDGFRRCGVFITIHIGSQALKEYGEVDIFNIVRIIKKRRHQLVTNEAEYAYCYQFLSTLIDLTMQVSPGSLTGVHPMPKYRRYNADNLLPSERKLTPRSNSFSISVSTPRSGKGSFRRKNTSSTVKDAGDILLAVVHNTDKGNNLRINVDSDGSTSDDSYRTVRENGSSHFEWSSQLPRVAVHQEPTRDTVENTDKQRSNVAMYRESFRQTIPNDNEGNLTASNYPYGSSNTEFPFNPYRRSDKTPHTIPTIVVTDEIY